MLSGECFAASGTTARTLPAFFASSSKRPFGYQDPQAWRHYGAWMQSNNLLQHPPDVTRAFTNEYLPGEGV